MEVDGSAEIPMCDSCGHRHIQGVRCSVCGHVGKSQIFSKMRQRANECRAVKVEKLAAASPLPKDTQFIDAHGMLSVVMELSGFIPQEIDRENLRSAHESELELSCNHVLCSVGDLPVATARWRIGQMEDGRLNLLIDRLVCVAEHRRSGFAYHCLYSILLSAVNTGTGFQTIEIIAPRFPGMEWVGEKLQTLGFVVANQSANGKAYAVDRSFPPNGVPAYSMILDVGGTGNPQQTLDSMVSFLLQKTSSLAN